MAITDFLDNVPPNPPGHVPYRPPPPAAGYEPPIVAPAPPPAAGAPPTGQFKPLPDNVIGWIMLMMGI